MDTKNVADRLMNEWTEFKADNERRLKEIEKNGRADPLTNEKVDRFSAALGDLQKQLDELVKKSARVSTTGVVEESPLAKEDYRKSFSAFMKRGRVENSLLEVKNAINISSDPAGGYLVPHVIEKEIEKYERDNSPMRDLCRVVSTTTENYEKLVKQGQGSSGWVDENEDREGDSETPTWAVLKPYFGEVYSEPWFTQKALDDAGIDLEAELGEDVGVEFSEQENDAFTRGSGIKKAKGLFAYGTAETLDTVRPFDVLQIIKSGVNGDFDTDNLIDLVQSVKRGYRKNGAFTMTNLAVAKLRKLKDATGNYLWQPTIVAGQPQTLLGYRLEENDDQADPAVDALAVAFGDFRRAYTIVDVRGTRMIRDDITKKGKVKLYFSKRVGGFLVNNRAVKLLKLSA